jgi:hypothetical protein
LLWSSWEQAPQLVDSKKNRLVSHGRAAAAY